MVANPWSFLTGSWRGWDASGFEFVAHNTYLTYGFELGLIGLVMFGLLWRSAYSAVLRTVDDVDQLTRTFMLAFGFMVLSLVFALTVVNLFKPWLYLWPMTGALCRWAFLETDAVSLRASPRSRSARRPCANGLPRRGRRSPGPPLTLRVTPAFDAPARASPWKRRTGSAGSPPGSGTAQWEEDAVCAGQCQYV